VYSLCMMWHHRLRKHFDINFKVLGTDSNSDNIDAAKKARFPGASMGEVPPEWLEKDFVRSKAGGTRVEFTLQNSLRKGVEFKVEDVLQGMPQGPFDLITCRYTICLYFAPDLLWSTLEKMVSLLADGGVLVVGAKEQLPQAHQRLGLAAHPHCPGAYVKQQKPLPRIPPHVEISQSPLGYDTLQDFLKHVHGLVPEWAQVLSGSEGLIDHHLRSPLQTRPDFTLVDTTRSHVLNASRNLLERAVEEGRWDDNFLRRMTADVNGRHQSLKKLRADTQWGLAEQEREERNKAKRISSSLSEETSPIKRYDGKEVEPGAVQRFLRRLEEDKTKRDSREARLASAKRRLSERMHRCRLEPDANDVAKDDTDLAAAARACLRDSDRSGTRKVVPAVYLRQHKCLQVPQLSPWLETSQPVPPEGGRQLRWLGQSKYPELDNRKAVSCTPRTLPSTPTTAGLGQVQRLPTNVWLGTNSLSRPVVRQTSRPLRHDIRNTNFPLRPTPPTEPKVGKVELCRSWDNDGGQVEQDMQASLDSLTRLKDFDWRMSPARAVEHCQQNSAVQYHLPHRQAT